MKLADLTYLLLDSTYVIVEDTDGNVLELYDGHDSLSGDYDDNEILTVCVSTRVDRYHNPAPALIITIEKED